jgi:D-alanyl-D-alanine carboxypeptidase (penicillin-binding protein 5/6)
LARSSANPRMSSPAPLLTGGARRRRGRRGHTGLVRRPTLWGRVLVIGMAISVLLIVLTGLLDPAPIRDSRSPVSRSAGKELSPQEAQAGQGVGEATAVDRHFAVNLAMPDVVRIRFVRKPRAGLMFDVRSGRVLWRLNPTRRLPIASLTKMMTALLVAERESPHDRVKITKEAVTTPGSGVGVLPKHKKVQLEALLNGLLLVSGNDAAVALAEHTAGSVRRFVRLMNERARELGLSCSRFSTPHGFRDRGNHSCAADLAALARADLAQRRIRRITRRDRSIVKFPIKGGRLFLYNNNPLVRAGYAGITGLKTGFTEKSGPSIVATAKRGRLELGVVLLHSYNPSEQARKLLDRGFKALQGHPVEH